VTYTTDISPAIQELKKLHNLLLDHYIAKGDEQPHPQGIAQARETVISILPGERRREDGWYKWRTWQKKSDSILHELDKSYKEAKYHEIYVTGESLSRSPEDIVLLMMHQTAHQAAMIQSTQSYHSEWIKIWHARMFQMKQEAWTRDEVLGWYNVDLSTAGQECQTLVSRLAGELEPGNFDLFRLKLKKSQGTGKMYKWTCECKSPIVRTGGILYAQCEKCLQPFKLDTKDVRDEFLARVPLERRWET